MTTAPQPTKNMKDDIPKPDHRIPQLNVMDMAVKEAGGAFRRHFLDIESMLTKKGGADSAYLTEAVQNLTNIVGTALHKTGKSVFLAPEKADELEDECWLLNAIIARGNFIRGRMPTGIRMVYLKDGKPTAAMLALPTTHETFYAAKGHGANGRTRLRVAGEKEALDIYAFIGAGSDTKLSTIATMAEENNHTLLHTACFAFSVCEVAGGRADALIGYGLTAGEVAFADLMIREAGGSIKTLSGEHATLDSTEIVIGSSSAVKQVLAQL